MARRAFVLIHVIIPTLYGCSSDTAPQQTQTSEGGALTNDASPEAGAGGGTVIDMPGDGPMPSCADGILNGDESDVDCGGFCSPCALTKTCRAHSDCASVHCINTDTDGADAALGKCRECAPGSNQCAGNKPSTCVDNMWVVANDECASGCDLNTGICITGSE